MMQRCASVSDTSDALIEGVVACISLCNCDNECVFYVLLGMCKYVWRLCVFLYMRCLCCMLCKSGIFV